MLASSAYRGTSLFQFTIFLSQNAKTRAFSKTHGILSASKNIQVSVEPNGVRNIVINRPEAKNALSFAVSY